MCDTGIHQNQMYVQPSKPLSDTVAHSVEGMSSPGHRAYNALDMPRVQWKPYLATGKHLHCVVSDKVDVSLSSNFADMFCEKHFFSWHLFALSVRESDAC